MAAFHMPRRGTAAYNAVVTLYAARAPLSAAALATRSGWKRGAVQFEDEVIGSLCAVGLAVITPKGIEITRAGNKFVGPKDAEPEYEGIPAAPRVGEGFRPLRSRSPMVIRAGALDYRDIPSMMGGVQVPYKSSVRPESE
ncbi:MULTISPECIES: hypothetical protein [unclassified Duganella]|uniref:hypothetical protein n=1 Tax=unclassified Duganella TaxID=2636909 RepID=UPI00087DFFD8|nr:MULTISPECIES: hypothetical protein [unclassified Duganella]SDH05561.1 hypothetical protein SAMN05216320_109130 [Duganella sp. OV458]SDK20580.1 hypothetical protein SAMN05428973_109152 [Duganella sp. OV510]